MKEKIHPTPKPEVVIESQIESQALNSKIQQPSETLQKLRLDQSISSQELHYVQSSYSQETKQSLESVTGVLFILIGALIHIKLAYQTKPNTIPKNLEQNKYTIEEFIKQLNAHDNDL